MSTLTTYLDAQPEVIYIGNTDVATGTTTLTDLTGTFAAGTEINAGVSRAGFGAACGVTGHSTCWEGAAVARGFQIATAANASLQLQSLSLGVFVCQTSAANGPTPVLGRQNGIYIGTSSTRKAGVALGGGPTSPVRTNPTTFTLNTWHLIGVTYDGGEIQVWVDGAREGSFNRTPGPFTTFVSKVAFGGDTGSTGLGTRLAIPFIANAPLDDGVWATIYELGLGAVTSYQIAGFDYVADAIPVVAASAAGTRCQACGGARRDLEGGIKQPSINKEAHVACFGARAAWYSSSRGAMSLTPTERDLDRYATRLIDVVLDNYTKRPTTDSPYYLDTTGQLQPGAQTANYGGVLAGLGALHRHSGGGPYSPYLQRMKLIMDYLGTNQIAVGLTKAGWFSTNGTFAGEFGGNGVFIFMELLPGVIAAWDSLDSTTQADWLDTLRRAADAEWAWEPANYWANGNIVLSQSVIYHLMAVLDPTQATKWNGYCDAYWDLMFRITTGTYAYAGGGGAGVGMRRYVDGTPTNDPLIASEATLLALTQATDKVYITEGNTATATAAGSTYNTTYGLDWNYTMEQGAIAMNAFMVTGDPRYEALMHMCANTVQPRHNLTGSSVTGPSGSAVPAWYSDYRGTRHNVSEIGHIYQLHALRRIGRTDLLTAQQQTDHQTFVENDAVLNTTQQNVWYRSCANVARSLWFSSYWPVVVV